MKHTLAVAVLTLLAMLCTVRALGQEPTKGQKLLSTGPSGVTTASGEAEHVRLPAPINIDHSDLGALARQIRARANARIHSRVLLEQDQTGKVVKTEKADATTDVWLYGVSQ